MQYHRRGRGRGGYYTGISSHPTGSSVLNPFANREPTEEELKSGLVEKIDTIPVPSAGVGVSGDVSISDFKAVASYSWRDQTDPTIIVPGHPLIWRDRPLPYTLQRDSGTVFVDQNASRLSASPLFPLIAAVTHLAPDFPLETVDFVTDRNGLRKLWRWAARDPKAGSFRIDVDMVGNKTILMQRWEPDTTAAAGPGYEQSFEKASTRSYPGCENSTGHHRIVSYDLDGLHMLVRYKVDACLPSGDSKTKQQTVEVEPTIDDLAMGLYKLSVSGSDCETVKKLPSSKGTLSIVTKGELVPQSTLIELKTRSINNANRIDWNDIYPQLLLSQTPNMFVCIHERGTFNEIDRKIIRELEGTPIAMKSQEGLGLLRKALGAIQDIVLEKGDGAMLSLLCIKGENEMKVFDRKGKRGLLPKDILELFEL